MNNFVYDLLGPVAILVIGLVSGYLKAVVRNSPLAAFDEFVKYIKGLSKPAVWAFISMFIILFGFGAITNDDYLELFQKAIIAGLYTASIVFIFMIWAANLIRQKK